MCHRIWYTKFALERAMWKFGLLGEIEPLARGTINPNDLAVIFCGRDGSPSMQQAKWGFAGKEGGLVINARSESIFTKPMFSSSALYRRCLVPAETFFEWDPAKNKVGFQQPGKELMYLAGLWKPANGTGSDDAPRFVVITAPANKSVENVHDRMPLLIDEDEARAWILDEDAAKELLKKPLPDLKQIREEEQLTLF
ncbi:MAG: SOS response-associated peptidase family protein [Firmicutes bacterium]|nr:SOS response-associated peptidase family protein [Bacillota bacterium]